MMQLKSRLTVAAARVVWALLIAMLGIPASFALAPSADKAERVVDLYLFVDQWPIWVGTTISYTVFEPTRVEGRVLSPSGEIIVVLNEGVKQPGQYTLPFSGNYHGSQFAGYYSFELYFGDEYAAKYQMAAVPQPPAT